jgi:hypothetical protein
VNIHSDIDKNGDYFIHYDLSNKAPEIDNSTTRYDMIQEVNDLTLNDYTLENYDK